MFSFLKIQPLRSDQIVQHIIIITSIAKGIFRDLLIFFVALFGNSYSIPTILSKRAPVKNKCLNFSHLRECTIHKHMSQDAYSSFLSNPLVLSLFLRSNQ
jgi:hypothetical protein